MLTYNAGCNETLRAGSCQRGVPLMLWVLLVDWGECEMQQTKGVCDGVAAHKAGRELLYADRWQMCACNAEESQGRLSCGECLAEIEGMSYKRGS